MRNGNSIYIQDTYKICMKCNNHHNELNTNLMVLNIIKRRGYKQIEQGDLLIRCDKGHILKYQSSLEHIRYCAEHIESKCVKLSEHNEFKKKR